MNGADDVYVERPIEKVKGSAPDCRLQRTLWFGVRAMLLHSP